MDVKAAGGNNRVCTEYSAYSTRFHTVRAGRYSLQIMCK